MKEKKTERILLLLRALKYISTLQEHLKIFQFNR